MQVLFALLTCFCLQAAASEASAPALDSKADRIDAFLGQAVDAGLFSGVLVVVEDGRVIYERASGKAEPGGRDIAVSDPFYLASISKQFTAGAVLLLAQRGELSVDDPVERYFPELPGWADSMTLRHLLTHTSGLGNYLDTDEPLWGMTNRDVLAHVARKPGLEFPPGDRYGYSNTGYVLLALVVEEVSGRSFGEFLREEIFDPLGMDGSAVYDPSAPMPASSVGSTDRFGRPGPPPFQIVGAGGLFGTAADLVRWHRALFSASLLDEDTLSEAFRSAELNDGSSSPYGFGWHVHDRPSGKALHHTGSRAGFRHFVFADLVTESVVILLTNRGDSFPLPDMATAVTNLLKDEPAELPKPAAIDHLWRLAASEPAALRGEAERLRREEPDRFRWSEDDFNELGYALLEEQRFVAAKGAFEAAIDAYPESGNVYDSYAECLLHAGLHDARANYRRSLELDPGNENAAEMLERIDRWAEE